MTVDLPFAAVVGRGREPSDGIWRAQSGPAVTVWQWLGDAVEGKDPPHELLPALRGPRLEGMPAPSAPEPAPMAAPGALANFRRFRFPWGFHGGQRYLVLCITREFNRSRVTTNDTPH